MECVMSSIPELTSQEVEIVRQTLRERYQHDVALDFAGSELRLVPDDLISTT
jgi:hypothetical protein